jgi:hypothetical protein
MSDEKLSNNARLLQKFEDEYEIKQSAKKIAMDLLMSIVDTIKFTKNREGCLGDMSWSPKRKKNNPLPAHVKTTIRKIFDTDTYDFDMRGDQRSCLVICHALQDARWWIFPPFCDLLNVEILSISANDGSYEQYRHDDIKNTFC